MPGRPVSILYFSVAMVRFLYHTSTALTYSLLMLLLHFLHLKIIMLYIFVFSVRVALELMDTRVRKESQEAVLDLAIL